VTAEVLVSDVGERWVTGRIVQSYAELSRGELITDRVPVAGRVRISAMTKVVDGFVIDTATTENLLIQRNQVIFIDRGRNDGVKSGSVFWVVRRGDGLAVKPRQIDQSLPDQVVGRLVVFSADDHVSTAIMTDQSLSVQIGDRITSRID
jgi:cell shape-determining protein MreC